MKTLFLLLCTILLQTVANAQLMTADERTDKRCTADLGGKALISITSPHDDLVIVCSSTKDNDQQKTVFKNAKGEFVYEFLLDLSVNNQRAYNISRKGSALRTRIEKITTRANECRYFYVTEVENGITLEEQEAQTNDTHFEEHEACVEITTELEGMKVNILPKSLPATIKRGKNAAGVNVISIAINLQGIQVYQQAQKITEEYNNLQASMANAPDEEFDKLDAQLQELEKEKKEAELKISQTGGLPSIEIHGENTNTLTIDIMKLGLTAKSKKCFAVLTLKEKVFGRAYNQYLESALQAEKVRKFTTAKGFYEQAANETDVTPEEKSACEDKIKEMDLCEDYMREANKALEQLQTLKKSEKEVDFSHIEALYQCVINNYNSLHQLRNDELFLKRVEKLQASLNNMDIVLTGCVVQTKKKQGVFQETPMTGVEIYALGGYKRDHVGSVDAQGHFKIQVKKSDYTELLFVPKEGKETKLKLGGKHLNIKVYIHD